MDKKSENILDKIDRRTGMTVPDGYFDNFIAKMSESLPEQKRPETAAVRPMTTWQRLRPYVYMAAMFAGVWCMMKMFSMMGDNSTDLSIENNHVITAALNNDDFVYDYVYQDVDDYELLEDMYQHGIPADDFALVPAALDTDETLEQNEIQSYQ